MGSFTYMLAPIEDMTDNAFRALCYRYGADLTFTEFARIAPLGKSNKNTLKRIELVDETPTTIQILGDDEQQLKRFLSKFRPNKGFKGFNLNLGCPNPSITKQGYGCAMVGRIAKTRKLVGIIRENTYPVSIKMRLGLTKKDEQEKSYLKLIDAVDADFFVVHGRYGFQSYNEPSDFSVYKDCVGTGKMIIANGDINTCEQVDALKRLGVEGVMIGRAAISYPALFNELKGLAAPGIEQLKKEYLLLAEQYHSEFRHTKNILKWMGRDLSGVKEN
jgi:tRNA-dihydrouridine synthase B